MYKEGYYVFKRRTLFMDQIQRFAAKKDGRDRQVFYGNVW